MRTANDRCPHHAHALHKPHTLLRGVVWHVAHAYVACAVDDNAVCARWPCVSDQNALSSYLSVDMGGAVLLQYSAHVSEPGSDTLQGGVMSRT